MKEFPENVIEAAQLSQDKTKSPKLICGIPASVSLAQWAVESAWGTKYSGKFNCFGIKAVAGQAGTEVITHEVINGQRIVIKAKFADYESLTEAFLAHAFLLVNGPRFAVALAFLPDIETFVKTFAKVYATDPNYSDLLLSIIEKHNLTQYDV